MKTQVYIPTRGYPYCEVIWRLNSEGIPYSFMMGSVSWSNTMNRCVEDFLNGDSEVCILVDDDTIPPPGFLKPLLDGISRGGFDVVGLPVLAAMPGEIFSPNVFQQEVIDGKYEFTPRFGHGLEEVEAVGSAIMAVHRRVFKKIKAPFSEKLHPNGTVELGGDLRFCRRAASQGFKIGCDFGFMGEHYRAVHMGATATAYTRYFSE